MSDWFKANGGPIAVVVLGLTLAGFTTPLAWGVVVLGVGWWLIPKALRRLPWEIRRKPRELSTNVPLAAEPTAGAPSWEELNNARVRRYEENRGLFLVHTWRPSQAEGQVADVEIRLWQHDEGPLTRGQIKAVEYILGPMFSDHSRVVTDPRNGFAIEESMYGPMLCLAKVYLSEDRKPLLLERYINFDLNEGIAAAKGRAPTDVHVELRDKLRRGRDMLQEIVGEQMLIYSAEAALDMHQRAFINAWTTDVATLLAQRDPAAAREFQAATDESGPSRTRELRDFTARVQKLESLLHAERRAKE